MHYFPINGDNMERHFNMHHLSRVSMRGNRNDSNTTKNNRLPKLFATGMTRSMTSSNLGRIHPQAQDI